MTKAEKIDKLQALITEGERLQELSYDTVTTKWEETVRIALSRLFPLKEYDKKFLRIFHTMRGGMCTAERYTKDYRTNFAESIAFLQAKITEIQEWDEETLNEKTPLEQVRGICERFSCSLGPLGKRRVKHAPYIINDEYDMQDIFHAYLSLFFDDIVPEERMPKVAGSSSDIDFFLKDSGIGIELKLTGSEKTKKDFKKELIQDMTDYQALPGIKQLVFFIYDPGKVVDHPKPFEQDLERSSKVPAIVMVRY